LYDDAFVTVHSDLGAQPSSAFGTFGATPAGQTPGNFSFPSFQTAQQGTDNTLFFWGHWEIGSFCIIIGT
jgi:hypothetical protein